jgi:hypothetical protein
LKFLPARSLRHSMLNSWSFRTVCTTFAYHPVTMDRDGVRRS